MQRLLHGGFTEIYMLRESVLFLEQFFDLKQNAEFGIGRLFFGGSFFGLLEVFDLLLGSHDAFHYKEQADGDDQEIDNRLNKGAVVQHKRRFAVFERNGQIGKIHAACEQTDQRADDAFYQRGNDLTESAADDHAYSHIDDIALECEFFEISHKFFHNLYSPSVLFNFILTYLSVFVNKMDKKCNRFVTCKKKPVLIQLDYKEYYCGAVLMKYKRIIALFLAAAVLFALASCGRNQYNNSRSEKTTAPTTTLPVVYTTAPNASDDEIQLGPFTFDEDEAEYLGTFETEIYADVSVYYQDQRLILFDSYGSKMFELYAYSYEPYYENTPIELVGEDVNFDGYTDFYLLYSQANFNSYYFFWLWNMQKRTFEYYLPLSSVPSPRVDENNRRIHSSDRISEDTLRTTDYIWDNGQITAISHGEQTIDLSPENTVISGPEDVDAKTVISDGHLLSSVTLQTNQRTNSDWLCRIENPAIVQLSSDYKDILTHTHNFVFKGFIRGTTTVVLRYAKSWTDPYVVQKILNVTVNADLTLRIVEVE